MLFGVSGAAGGLSKEQVAFSCAVGTVGALTS